MMKLENTQDKLARLGQEACLQISEHEGLDPHFILRKSKISSIMLEIEGFGKIFGSERAEHGVKFFLKDGTYVEGAVSHIRDARELVRNILERTEDNDGPPAPGTQIYADLNGWIASAPDGTIACGAFPLDHEEKAGGKENQSYDKESARIAKCAGKLAPGESITLIDELPRDQSAHDKMKATARAVEALGDDYAKTEIEALVETIVRMTRGRGAADANFGAAIVRSKDGRTGASFLFCVENGRKRFIQGAFAVVGIDKN
jgi:hypothetical protein